LPSHKSSSSQWAVCCGDADGAADGAADGGTEGDMEGDMEDGASGEEGMQRRISTIATNQ
jgi:hypothetical protein